MRYLNSLLAGIVMTPIGASLCTMRFCYYNLARFHHESYKEGQGSLKDQQVNKILGTTIGNSLYFSAASISGAFGAYCGDYTEEKCEEIEALDVIPLDES